MGVLTPVLWHVLGPGCAQRRQSAHAALSRARILGPRRLSHARCPRAAAALVAARCRRSRSNTRCAPRAHRPPPTAAARELCSSRDSLPLHATAADRFRNACALRRRQTLRIPVREPSPHRREMRCDAGRPHAVAPDIRHVATAPTYDCITLQRTYCHMRRPVCVRSEQSP
jgi:hypothetical protein